MVFKCNGYMKVLLANVLYFFGLWLDHIEKWMLCKLFSVWLKYLCNICVIPSKFVFVRNTKYMYRMQTAIYKKKLCKVSCSIFTRIVSNVWWMLCDFWLFTGAHVTNVVLSYTLPLSYWFPLDITAFIFIIIC